MKINEVLHFPGFQACTQKHVNTHMQTQKTQGPVDYQEIGWRPTSSLSKHCHPIALRIINLMLSHVPKVAGGLTNSVRGSWTFTHSTKGHSKNREVV